MIRKILMVVGAIGLVGLIGYGMVPKPAAVEFTPVTVGPMRVTVDEEGKTRIKERYTVSAPLGGQLRRITLKPGDRVHQGKTVLAVVEPNDPGFLDARAKATSEAREKAAQAARRQSAAHLDRAKHALDFAESEHRRTAEAYSKGSSTEQAKNEAEMMLRTRREELKAAQFAEQISAFELEQAKAALLQFNPPANGSTEPSTARFEIPSPIDGQVLQVLRESATIVTPGNPLVEVGDPRDLEVVVQVLSTDAVAIKPGAEVSLENWGGLAPLNGRVRRKEPAGFTKISALGVEEQRVNVLVDLTDPFEVRKELGDAYRLEARIVVWTADKVTKAPMGALFRQDKGWAAYRVENGVARLRELTVGRLNALEAQIISGLDPDDVLIAHPGDKVKDGTKVISR